MRGYQLAHARAAEGEDLVGDIGVVGRPEEHRHFEAERIAGDRQQLEIARMGREDDKRPRIVAQVGEDRNAGNFHPARLVLFRIEIEQPVKEDVFGGEPAHMAPARDRDLFKFLVGLFRVGIAQVDEHQLVAAELRPDATRHSVGEPDTRIRRKDLEKVEEPECTLRHQPLLEVEERQSDPGDEHLHAWLPQSIRSTILPNTWRVSIRSSALSISAKVTSVSITG